VRAWLRELPGTGLSVVEMQDLSEEDRREREVIRILGDLQEKTDDLFALYQITQFLNNTQDLNQLCTLFLRELERITGSEVSCLYLSGPAGGLVPNVWHGLGIAPAGRADSVSAHAWFATQVQGRHVLALPLLAEERLVGLALLAHRREVARGRQRFLQTVSKEMGTALLAMEGRQALLAQEQKLEAIVDSTTDGIIQVGSDLRVRDFNPAAEHLTAHTADQAIARSCSQVLGCGDGQSGSQEGCGGNCPFARVLNEHEPIPYAEIVISASGERRYLAASVAELDLGKETGVAAVGILRDVSKQKQIEHMKDDFLASVSHQLRTPLALLRGYVDTLQHLQLSPQEQKGCVDGISTTTARLEHLVRQLLDVTRIEDGRLDLQVEPVRLVDVARNAINALPHTAYKSRIWTELAPDLPLLRADQGKLEEVLINLLDNACKYSPPTGQVVVRASATAPADGSVRVLVQVLDEGIGIPPEDQQAVFEKFHRAENARVMHAPGTGLGLFICKSIVEGHGGRMVISSSPGEGTCVQFWIPAA
jgi:PAS domain S-box-containing protein